MSDQDQMMPPAPVVPSNVLEVGMPERSDSVTVEGALIDYIPLAMYCGQANGCSGKVTTIDYPITGIMAPDGTVHQPKWSYDGDSGELLYIYMADPNSDLGVGTTVEQVLYWQLISQAWVAANEPHSKSIAVTSGISESETQSMSFSVGANIGFGASTSKMNGDLSASLTKSFSTTVTISESTTVTENFSFAAAATQQVCAVYQLMQAFQISPGPNLLQAVASVRTTQALFCSGKLIGPCHTLEVVMPVTCPEAGYMQLSGTDTSPQAKTVNIMSPDELKRLTEMLTAPC